MVMVHISFEQLLEAAKQLSPQQQDVLVRQLAHDNIDLQPITRERIIAEFEARKAAGELEVTDSLRGKYARPDLDISEEELNSYLRDIGREWESELDELAPHN
jgi:hypothetical protein